MVTPEKDLLGQAWLQRLEAVEPLTGPMLKEGADPALT
jgi:hypothetical protein